MTGAGSGQSLVVVAIRLDDFRWSIDGVQVSTPAGESPIEFVLGQLFARVVGEGPWRADVHDGGPAVHSLLLHPDGSVTEVAETVADAATSHVVKPVQAPLVAVAPVRERGPVFGRRALFVGAGVIGLAGVGAVAGHAFFSGTAPARPASSSPAPSLSPSPTPTAGAEVLWRLPDGVSGVRAAGPVVAGVVNGHLVVFDGVKGTPLPGASDLAVADPALVRVASGGGASVIDIGGGAGAVVINGKAARYQGKGALLGRGPVPVLVGGTATARTCFAIKNNALTVVKASQAGNSLFGGLPGGGTVWAVAGGKVTYAPATGTHRTVTLAPPLKGAKVTSWVAVSETRTALIWTKGTDSVLAIHATGPGAKGTIEFQHALQSGQTAWAEDALVVIGPGQAGVKAPGALIAVIALQGAKAVSTPVPTGASLVDGRAWTPAKAGTWSADGFNIPRRPVAAGDGFALINEGEKVVAVPGPNTTTK